MITTDHDRSRLRAPALDRETSMTLAATEYQRVADLLGSLEPEQWTMPTECPGWTVRDLAAHMLGMVEMAASLREQLHQTRAARRRSTGVFIDALTALQIEERAGMTPAQIRDRFAVRAPKAVRGRRRIPGFVRRRPLAVPGEFGGIAEPWQIGFLTDIVLTRDPWMHRIDITRATGAEHVLTAEHDGVLVADVVAEWADRHGEPYTLHLAGPAGGHWSQGRGGPEIELDAIEFTRILSGRASGTGLLSTPVPF
ncbi:maleylpyruvate isomerase family mycothiol-dependent enzyme [Aldersonia sp. NBC_00410]|uniref:maleylpyruvate isomerase family mycothiol-dependent enzyme n=1 Tax=Aldersonia sp. NBC_00410 TaxID=2975954 RepID=UPI00225A84D8|nr:maleylpyruvate isomerase family mycothiol-dependent enzyme [Aldersonia sp. NBC_00410]MCX5043195.1 maleylpyruvate isomerase family mycothiol-dependent enzyme [Aldersonia sp. NBC_00410]